MHQNIGIFKQRQPPAWCFWNVLYGLVLSSSERLALSIASYRASARNTRQSLVTFSQTVLFCVGANDNFLLWLPRFGLACDYPLLAHPNYTLSAHPLSTHAHRHYRSSARHGQILHVGRRKLGEQLGCSDERVQLSWWDTSCVHGDFRAGSLAISQPHPLALSWKIPV